jgi:hypothetical protein
MSFKNDGPNQTPRKRDVVIKTEIEERYVDVGE